MATTSSRSCRTRAATALICAVAVLGFSSLCAPICLAGTLQPVTAAAEEAVGATGLTVPTAPETGAAAVTAPVQKVVESVVPPAAAVPQPVAAPPVHLPSGTPPEVEIPPAGGAPSAQAPVETVVHGASEVVAGAAAPTRTAPNVTAPSPVVHSAGGGADRSTPEASASDTSAAADPAASADDQPSPSRRTTFVPAPTENGATGAPQPRWIAYVWPAVALLGPGLANFAAEWGQAAARLATGISTSTGSSTASQGVAGVHASGGSTGSSDSSLFAKIPSAGARQFYSVSTPALIYLGLVTLAVIAVALGVRREIVLGRRR